MRLDIRTPKRQFTKTEFDRWLNGGRHIKLKTDKACALRSRYMKFERVLHRIALYGQDRGF